MILRDTYIDLRHDKKFKGKLYSTRLQHLTIDRSWFYPVIQAKTPIQLKSFKQISESCEWPQDFTNLTQLQTLEKLVLTGSQGVKML